MAKGVIPLAKIIHFSKNNFIKQCKELIKLNTYVVYKHTNLINHKVYIGITKYREDPNRRWRNGMGYSYNQKFFPDIIKFGWDNFTHEILESNLNEIEANARERYYIEKYNSVQNGYNQLYGGNVMSAEGRKAISKALTGLKRQQESIDKQMNTKHKRYGNGRGINYLGSNAKKVKCNETGDVFASISEANRWANTCKVGECCKGSRAHAGVHPITKQKLSWSFVNSDAMVSISCEEDRKNKKTIKQIICIETNKVYESASEASRDTGVAICNILRVCRGERKSAGKLHWKFKEE